MVRHLFQDLKCARKVGIEENLGIQEASAVFFKESLVQCTGLIERNACNAVIKLE